MEARHRTENDELARRERTLAQERKQLDLRHQREAKKLRVAAKDAHDTYQAALNKWEP